jgi:hypothetical protein
MRSRFAGAGYVLVDNRASEWGNKIESDVLAEGRIYDPDDEFPFQVRTLPWTTGILVEVGQDGEARARLVQASSIDDIAVEEAVRQLADAIDPNLIPKLRAERIE